MWLIFILGTWALMGALIILPSKVPSGWERAKQLINVWYVERFVKVDSTRKCPACGHRKEHTFVWSENHEAILHKCAACSAVFGERPVFATDSWRVTMRTPEPEPTEEELRPRAPFGASREPVIMKKRDLA
jgi:hypothetical protein